MAGSLLLCGFIDFDIVGIFLDVLCSALRFNDRYDHCGVIYSVRNLLQTG